MAESPSKSESKITQNLRFSQASRNQACVYLVRLNERISCVGR